MKRSTSTISRELARNAGERGYRPRQAHTLAVARERCQRGGKPICGLSWQRCQQLTREGHSPAQAVGRTQVEGYACISHETAYKRVYADRAAGGTLWRTLRCCKLRCKRYGSGHQRRGKIPNRVGIEKRCPRVLQHARVGHWEGDTVIGKNKKYALVTLVERKTGYALVRRVKTRQAAAWPMPSSRPWGRSKRLVRTITFDNG